MSLKSLILAGVVAGVATAASAASWEEILHAGSQSRDWLNYGGDLGQMRFVPSDQINVDNVDGLRLKWIHQSGIVGSYENTPIVERGVMYITTPYNHVFAIDAATGRELWHYEHKLGTTIFCCGPNNRGVAIAGNLVYMATLDAMLIALDKRSGELVWETEIADPEAGYSETHAPVIYKDKVILGISGAEYGIRGFVSAYNKDTGDLIWRTHLIPAPDEASPDGVKGWEGVYVAKADGINPLHRDVAGEKAAVASGKYADSWKRGGASQWMTPSIDPDLGLVVVTTGNPSPDLDGSVRPGDNRWSDSLLALDIETGEIKWAYQYVPHDVWDLDAVSPPILADVADENGNMVPGAIHGGKTGWVYVHDRRDGRLIRRSPSMVPQENLFAQPTEAGTRMLPGANGGVEWSPGAFSPDTRMVYYVNLHQPMDYITHNAPYAKGRLWLGSAFVAIPGEQQWGNVTAVDVDNGWIVWQAKTEQPMIGGALVTAGDVVFAGEGNGLFKAYNARTGEQLWQFQAGAGVNSAPMAFEVDGKLHIAVASGGVHQTNFKRGDALLVFALE
ncbi:MAG: pyrroloquinoline quinone-dependent dehydrogenase [Alphaproteobacteria bacterium]